MDSVPFILKQMTGRLQFLLLSSLYFMMRFESSCSDCSPTRITRYGHSFKFVWKAIIIPIDCDRLLSYE
jgi:hypothetical protein